jgi:hypothetical protein
MPREAAFRELLQSGEGGRPLRPRKVHSWWEGQREFHFQQ